MEKWRLIKDSPRNAASNLSIDEVLLKNLDEKGTENILKFNYFTPPAVILGINQTTNVLNTNFIQKNQFDINRRLTGGAAILIGYPHKHSQMGLSFFVRLNEKIPLKLSDKFKYFSNILIKTLKRLDLNPKYNKNSDISVNGRKIVGNGIYILKNAFLFHSIILLDFNFFITSKILKLDDPKVDEKLIPTSLKNEMKQDLSFDILENKIIETIKVEWNVKFNNKKLNKEEFKLSEQLRKEKYAKNSWILQKSENLAEFGSCFIPSEN
ncbi:MAG: lipoate--protein ligase family protein [Candidatus Lokiarchaeota archaeon]|nr:lipoate--protein ligase family protein [Candidatus Lokiarchaeota archaeon]